MNKKRVILPIAFPVAIEQEPSPSAVGACDRKGRCYWGRFYKGTWSWRYQKEPGPASTHWLPASITALPVRIPFTR